MNKPLVGVGVVTVLSLVAFGAIAYDPPPDSVAQPGDPARWYKPADTAQKLYKDHVKEAGAALKEAIADCRQGAKSDRRDCVAEAMQTYHDDMKAAKEQRDANS